MNANAPSWKRRFAICTALFGLILATMLQTSSTVSAVSDDVTSLKFFVN